MKSPYPMMMNIKAILLRKKNMRYPKGRFWHNLGLKDKNQYTAIRKSTGEVVWKKGEYNKYIEELEEEDKNR